MTTLQLSNSHDRTPIVHSLFERSTSTWQYIVADPATRRCIVIDPVRDYCSDETTMSTTATDAIVDLVKQHGYIVHHILETNSAFNSRYRSGTWLLRMQLADIQEHAPVVNSAGTVASLAATWQRRHGETVKFSTSLGEGLKHGDSWYVGRMNVHCVDLPSYNTPKRRAFLIAGNVFGAHSLAILGQRSKLFLEADPGTPMNQDSARATWTSMHTILSYNESFKLFYDLADSNKTYHEQQPYDEVAAAREINEYYSLASSADFYTRWQGQQQELHGLPPKVRKKVWMRLRK